MRASEILKTLPVSTLEDIESLLPPSFHNFVDNCPMKVKVKDIERKSVTYPCIESLFAPIRLNIVDNGPVKGGGPTHPP